MVHESLKKVKRVIISIGHDKTRVGAMNKRGEKENTLATDIAVKVAQYLRANGLVVWLMPDYTLADTIKYLNIQGNAYTDMALEIHKDSSDKYNEANMRRRCGLYFAAENAGAKTIASAMVNTMIKEGAHVTSWVRPDTDSNHGRLGFCAKTKMLAMIAEMGFIEGSNAPDENEWYAWALAKSILQVLEMPIRAIPINGTTIQPIL
jgi:N-acetylmuramoyl-L-alanine amidase